MKKGFTSSILKTERKHENVWIFNIQTGANYHQYIITNPACFLAFSVVPSQIAELVNYLHHWCTCVYFNIIPSFIHKNFARQTFESLRLLHCSCRINYKLQFYVSVQLLMTKRSQPACKKINLLVIVKYLHYISNLTFIEETPIFLRDF